MGSGDWDWDYRSYDMPWHRILGYEKGWPRKKRSEKATHKTLPIRRSRCVSSIVKSYKKTRELLVVQKDPPKSYIHPATKQQPDDDTRPKPLERKTHTPSDFPVMAQKRLPEPPEFSYAIQMLSGDEQNPCSVFGAPSVEARSYNCGRENEDGGIGGEWPLS